MTTPIEPVPPLTPSSFRPAPKSGLRAGRRVLAVLGTILVLWILVVEVAFRWLPIAAFSQGELMPAFLETRKNFNAQGHPYLAFVPMPEWERAGAPRQRSHNEHGLRGPSLSKEKPPGVFRVVCLGGSSTYGHTPSSDAATWPARLGQYLNEGQDARRVEVLNGGFSGYSSFESTANLLFRLLDFAPDLVIVYHTINDARCALWGENPRGDNTHFRAIWPIYDPTPTERLLEKSMTYLIFRRYFTRYIQDMGDMGVWGIVDYDPLGPNPYVTSEPSPVGFQSFERNLVSIQAIARGHGASLILSSQGCDRADIKGPARGSQWAAMDAMEGILRAVSSEHGLVFVDGRAALDVAAKREGVDAIYTHEVHLTDRGCEVLARALAGTILALDLIR